MSSSRPVDSYFWDDPWVHRIGTQQRYLYLYFLTNSLANIAGIYEITDDRITQDTGLTEAELHLALDSFRTAKKVYRWGDWIIMRNWPKHQTKSPKVQAGIERILEGLTPEMLGFLVAIEYQYQGLKEVAQRLDAVPYVVPGKGEKGGISILPDTLSNQETKVSNPGNIGYPEKEISNQLDTLSNQENTLSNQSDRVSHSTLLYSTGRAPMEGPRPGEESPQKPPLVEKLVDNSKPHGRLEALFKDLKTALDGESN